MEQIKVKDQRSWSVFTLTNVANNKKYVGVALGDGDPYELKDRNYLFRHLKSPELRKDIDEMGWDVFEFDVVASNLNKVDAYKKACTIMKEWVCFDQWGYNNMPFQPLYYKPRAMSNGHTTKKRVRQYDMNGNVIAEFESAGEAARAMGCYPQHMQAVCRGDAGRKTLYGYRWEYITEDK